MSEPAKKHDQIPESYSPKEMPEILVIAEKMTASLKTGGRLAWPIVGKGSFRVIGRRRVTPSGGGTWDVCRADGSLRRMEELQPGQPFLGLCFGFGKDGGNDYMVGIVSDGGDVPGLESFTYPASRWMIFEAEGKISDNVLGNAWKSVYKRYLPKSGYKQSALPTMESYVVWEDDRDYCRIEIHIPIEK